MPSAVSNFFAATKAAALQSTNIPSSNNTNANNNNVSTATSADGGGGGRTTSVLPAVAGGVAAAAILYGLREWKHRNPEVVESLRSSNNNVNNNNRRSKFQQQQQQNQSNHTSARPRHRPQLPPQRATNTTTSNTSSRTSSCSSCCSSRSTSSSTTRCSDITFYGNQNNNNKKLSDPALVFAAAAVDGFTIQRDDENETNTAAAAVGDGKKKTRPPPLHLLDDRVTYLNHISESVWMKLKMLHCDMNDGTTLFQAMHKASGEIVALKEVIQSGGGIAIARSHAHLRRELQVLSTLRHENLVRIQNIEILKENNFNRQQQPQQKQSTTATKENNNNNNIIQQQQNFNLTSNVKFRVAFEYCSGGTLATHLKETGIFENELRLRCCAKQLLGALCCLHENSAENGGAIIHRNLTPNSIFLTQNGTLKIAEVGRARFTDTVADTKRISGTVLYLAPEVIRGSCVAASDLWNLGCILVECVSGMKPWQNQIPSLPNSNNNKNNKNSNNNSSRSSSSHLLLSSEFPNPETELLHIMRFIADIPEDPNVAMNHHPRIPTDTLDASLSEDCIQFLKKLLNPDPAMRGSARELLEKDSWINSE